MVGKRKNYKDTFREYMRKEVKLEGWQKVGIVLLVVVASGFTGWLYEFLLVAAENGEIYMKGGNLLPWMNIYAIGALVIMPATYKLRRQSWAVFLVATLVTGLVELVGGWLVYTIGDGTRYWNYAEGVWTIGSINGFVCLLSVIIFGIGALLLMYLVLPTCIYLARRMSKRVFLGLAVGLFAIVMMDEVTNLTLKNLGLPNAMDFYRSLGMEYK